ncbi:MAG: tRNA (adenosine(37)-N6)-dimethylallyltransferase MiaA [Betaproteobacteria bacterium]|nr:tRNA (adenosine(37)-N6)-dimethylallyltransferase MiaA [Betaproteobacteria bacterium]
MRKKQRTAKKDSASRQRSPVTPHQSPDTRQPSAVTRHPQWPPAVLLMGPTASGKTAVATAIAGKLPCEIVSVDSAQIYRHMNVGTAKPGTELLERVPHHLVDIVEPHESYSAARFRDDALIAMREITERGNVPLLVGGTMLYFQALTEGLNELPEADAAIRLVIDTMADESGWPALHGELARVDPETAARLKPNDAQRIQRALEVYYLTNTPMSELLRKPKCVYYPYSAIKIALVPGERERLHERIGRRFEDMLELGLITELRKLRNQYALEPTMPSMRCVGYRQVWQYLDGEFGLAALREKGVAATRQLAKRQLTWLRATKDVEAFDCLAEDVADQVLDYLQRALEKLSAVA